MKLIRIIGALLFFLGSLAALAVIIDERVSKHETDAWERDYGGRMWPVASRSSFRLKGDWGRGESNRD